MGLERIEARDRAKEEANPGDVAILATRIKAELGIEPGAVIVGSLQILDQAIALAVSHGMAIAWNRAAQRRTCRVCGCWELHACDGGCWWAGEDICSSCAKYGPPPSAEQLGNVTFATEDGAPAPIRGLELKGLVFDDFPFDDPSDYALGLAVAALAPFARFMPAEADWITDDQVLTNISGADFGPALTAQDFRRAADAFAQLEDQH